MYSFVCRSMPSNQPRDKKSLVQHIYIPLKSFSYLSTCMVVALFEHAYLTFAYGIRVLSNAVIFSKPRAFHRPIFFTSSLHIQIGLVNPTESHL